MGKMFWHDLVSQKYIFDKKKKKKKLGYKPHKNKKYFKNYFIKEANWCPNMFPKGT